MYKTKAGAEDFLPGFFMPVFVCVSPAACPGLRGMLQRCPISPNLRGRHVLRIMFCFPAPSLLKDGPEFSCSWVSGFFLPQTHEHVKRLRTEKASAGTDSAIISRNKRAHPSGPNITQKKSHPLLSGIRWLLLSGSNGRPCG